MSQWEKLLKKVLALDSNMRFEELQKILEGYGYSMHSPKGGSSHCTFRKPGLNPITIPKHKPVKKIYIEMVKDVVERENKKYEND